MTGSRDIAASIRTDRSFLDRIEHDAELNQDDPNVVELKRVICRRIAQLESELQRDMSSPQCQLQVTYNCGVSS